MEWWFVGLVAAAAFALTAGLWLIVGIFRLVTDLPTK